eukprot:CAMPEP_0171077386 /NCGR_PEP_ID=MMETSP0766_2-20121228/14003_1 /TAXON_ID=439317 /ORGANISM="Gambierdiscus australes, Strain CAWD 149" /LENGTH=408 /DNA_ID=CAMNT_0011534447 /DNA_START=1 /DNA_END=1226 /DNA_ORIENTATION=+
MSMSSGAVPAFAAAAKGGATLPSMQWSPYPSDEGSSCLTQFQTHGDPYADTGDIFRDCLLAPDLVPGSSPLSCAYDEGTEGEPWPCEVPDLIPLGFGQDQKEFCCHTEGSSPRGLHVLGESGWPNSQAEAAVGFSDAFEPLELSFGQHEVTSLPLEGVSAAEAARCIHTFLTQELKSSIRTVKPAKFSIKADVFDEEGGCLTHCCLKARVWARQGGGRGLLVEFRRCQGDALVFGRTYSRASQYLLGKLVPSQQHEQPAVMSLPVPTALPQPEVAPQELQPHVDRLADSCPWVQAEALSGLLAVSCANSKGAIEVCATVSLLQSMLAPLVASAYLDVAYPTAAAADVAHTARGLQARQAADAGCVRKCQVFWHGLARARRAGQDPQSLPRLIRRPTRNVEGRTDWLTD